MTQSRYFTRLAVGEIRQCRAALQSMSEQSFTIAVRGGYHTQRPARSRGSYTIDGDFRTAVVYQDRDAAEQCRRLIQHGYRHLQLEVVSLREACARLESVCTGIVREMRERNREEVSK